MPLVSAIVSTYNAEQFIRDRIENLLQQTIVNEIEVIIVNSGSQEGEEAIINEFRSVGNIKYIKIQQRETVYQAWNRGIKISTGKFVTNANTDDRSLPEAFETMAGVLESDSSVAMVYADQYITNIPNAGFPDINRTRRFFRPKVSPLQLLWHYPIGSQPMWRSSLHFEENLWFNEVYEVAGDYDFALRVAERGEIRRIRKVLGYYYRSSGEGNKEYQDYDRTVRETVRIQNIYLRKSIASMKQLRRGLLKYQCKVLIHVPNAVFKIIYRLLKVANRAWRVLPKEYWIWMYSAVLESQDNRNEALAVLALAPVQLPVITNRRKILAEALNGAK